MKLEKQIFIRRGYFFVLLITLILFFLSLESNDTTLQNGLMMAALVMIMFISLFNLESYPNDRINSNIHRTPKKGELIRIITKKEFTSIKEIKEEKYFYYLYLRDELMSSFISKEELEEEKTYIISSDKEFVLQ